MNYYCKCGETQSFIYGNNLVGSKRSREERNYYFHDEMESVIRITDTEGKNKRIFQYNAFGDMKDFGEKFDRERILLSFTGYEAEKDFSLMYAQARYYMPETGRFKEEDSNKGNGFIPESLNYYIYCYNNPLLYIDLDGKEPQVINTYLYKKSYKVNPGFLRNKIDEFGISSDNVNYNKETKVATITFKESYKEDYIERTIIFKVGEDYVYEIDKLNNTTYKRVYNLKQKITTINVANNKYNGSLISLDTDDLDYIFSCIYGSGRNNFERSCLLEKNYGYTKIYFQKTGDKIMYINNPETISSINFEDNPEQESRFYYKMTITEMEKDHIVEFYSGSYFSGLVGISIYSLDDKPFNVKIKNINMEDIKNLLSDYPKNTYNAIQLDNKDEKDKEIYKRVNKEMIAARTVAATKLYENFFSSSGYEIKVKKNQAAFLLCGELFPMFIIKNISNENPDSTDIKYNLLTGRVKFSVNQPNIEVCSCFLFEHKLKDLKYKNNSYVIDKNIITSLTRFNYINEDRQNVKVENRTTAIMNFSVRKAIIFAKDGAKFVLSNSGNQGFPKDINIGELEDLNMVDMNLGYNPKGFDRGHIKINLGNFGIIYEIQLLGAQGKKIFITSYTTGHAATVLLCCGKYGKWKGYIFNNSISKYSNIFIEDKSIDVPEDGFIKFMLPGGNNGDVLFEIK